MPTTNNNYAVVLYTNGDNEIITLDLDNTGTQLNDLVGGYFECISLKYQGIAYDMWVNEEGKLQGLPFNQIATYLYSTNYALSDAIAGNAVLTGGTDADGNTLGLTLEEAEAFKNPTSEREKQSFVVWQRAEIWYTTNVEAKSAGEALSRVKHPSYSGDWTIEPNTEHLQDDFEVWTDDGEQVI